MTSPNLESISLSLREYPHLEYDFSRFRINLPIFERISPFGISEFPYASLYLDNQISLSNIKGFLL